MRTKYAFLVCSYAYTRKELVDISTVPVSMLPKISAMLTHIASSRPGTGYKKLFTYKKGPWQSPSLNRSNL